MNTRTLRRMIPLLVLMGLMLGVLRAPIPQLQAQEVGTGEAVEALVEGGQAELEEHAEGGPLSIILRWVNLAILLGGLGYLLRKPAAEFFNARSNDITTGLERSRHAQNAATQRMADIEQRLSQLSVATAQIQSDARVSAETERDRIVADARAEAGRAVVQSQADVERLRQGMELEIREYIADNLIEVASSKLRSRLTEEDQGRMVRKAVERL